MSGRGLQFRHNSAAGPANSITLSLTNALSGNAIVGSVAWRVGSGSVSSITVSGNSNATILDTKVDATNGVTVTTFYLLNVVGGNLTLTVNLSANETSIVVQAFEVSGIQSAAALDAHNINLQASPGTGTNAITSGTGTTSLNGDWIFGVVYDTTNGASNPTSGTAFVIRDSLLTTQDFAAEDRTQANAASQAATFTTTLGTDSFITAMMAFLVGNPFSISGVSTDNAAGSSTVNVPASAAGISTDTATGSSTVTADASSAGISTAIAVGADADSVAASAIGVATVSGAASAVSSAAANSNGIATAMAGGASKKSSPITRDGARVRKLRQQRQDQQDEADLTVFMMALDQLPQAA